MLTFCSSHLPLLIPTYWRTYDCMHCRRNRTEIQFRVIFPIEIAILTNAPKHFYNSTLLSTSLIRSSWIHYIHREGTRLNPDHCKGLRRSGIKKSILLLSKHVHINSTLVTVETIKQFCVESKNCINNIILQNGVTLVKYRLLVVHVEIQLNRFIHVQYLPMRSFPYF